MGNYAGNRLFEKDPPDCTGPTGYSQTDFVKGVANLENWPGDIACLADSLKIKHFAVFGVSGGGAYALACAWKIPARLSCAGVFTSVAPFIAKTEQKINPAIRIMWKVALRFPGYLSCR